MNRHGFFFHCSVIAKPASLSEARLSDVRYDLLHFFSSHGPPNVVFVLNGPALCFFYIVFLSEERFVEYMPTNLSFTTASSRSLCSIFVLGPASPMAVFEGLILNEGKSH